MRKLWGNIKSFSDRFVRSPIPSSLLLLPLIIIYDLFRPAISIVGLVFLMIVEPINEAEDLLIIGMLILPYLAVFYVIWLGF